MKKLSWVQSLVAVCLLTVIWLGVNAEAEELFVANSPYKGVVVGGGDELKVLVSEISELLDIQAVEEDGNWTLGDFPLPVSQEDGQVWVRISDLPKDLVRIVKNQELGTVDIYLTDEVQKGVDRTWAGMGKLVVFYDNDSPACLALDRSLEDLILAETIDVIIVDIDFPKEENYRNYVRYFQGDRVPYFVILDKKGKVLDSFAEFQTYNEILSKLKNAFSK